MGQAEQKKKPLALSRPRARGRVFLDDAVLKRVGNLASNAVELMCSQIQMSVSRKIRNCIAAPFYLAVYGLALGLDFPCLDFSAFSAQRLISWKVAGS